MARSNVPKFGNWDTEDISYTTYFENPRKNSSSEKVNSNSSPGNPNVISKQEVPRRSEAAKMTHALKVSQEDGELQRAAGSPSHRDGRRRTCRDSTDQQFVGLSGSTPKRAPRPNGGVVRSADHSPLHPYYQAKIASKENAVPSPSWERRSSTEAEASHCLAPSAPGRTRLKSVPRGNETPDRGVASVPKFGEWDETDPSSADGFTHIFNKVKEDRHRSVGTGAESQLTNGRKQYRSKDSKGCSCFPWG